MSVLSSASAPLTSLGVGIDTARQGHRVCFLRPDRLPAAPPMTVLENRQDYDLLRQRLDDLRRQHPQAHVHIRVDAAGQYADNLLSFLRQLPWPMTLSVGEPKRNKDYHKAHFPKRSSDATESHAMARFAVVEQPAATPQVPEAFVQLREIAGRLQSRVKQSTRAINCLHHLLARVFPELTSLAPDISANWVLTLLANYPSAAKIAKAQLSSLSKIPYLPKGRAEAIREAAQRSVGSLGGPHAESLVEEAVTEVRHCCQAERRLRQLLIKVHGELPAGGHRHLASIPGIGAATAAILTAHIIDIDRFTTPNHLVGFFGVFPEENSSGVDRFGKPLPAGTMAMSHKGNDLIRAHLWLAAKTGVCRNPALKALFKRLRGRGKRGDVSLGRCMTKLLHLVFAIWKTNRPFQPLHFPWDGAPLEVTAELPAGASALQAAPIPAASVAPAPTETPPPLTMADDNTAVGHKREQSPQEKVVTTAADSSVKPARPAVNSQAAPTLPEPRRRVDFAWIRGQVTMERILQHLGVAARFRGQGLQRRGPCPVHRETDARRTTCSVHLGKNVFHCFQVNCQAKGNTLDLWAAVHQLPLYEAALHLAETFQLSLNREEEPVKAPVTNQPPNRQPTGPTAAVTTADGT